MSILQNINCTFSFKSLRKKSRV